MIALQRKLLQTCKVYVMERSEHLGYSKTDFIPHLYLVKSEVSEVRYRDYKFGYK